MHAVDRQPPAGSQPTQRPPGQVYKDRRQDKTHTGTHHVPQSCSKVNECGRRLAGGRQPTGSQSQAGARGTLPVSQPRRSTAGTSGGDEHGGPAVCRRPMRCPPSQMCTSATAHVCMYMQCTSATVHGASQQGGRTRQAQPRGCIRARRPIAPAGHPARAGVHHVFATSPVVRMIIMPKVERRAHTALCTTRRLAYTVAPPYTNIRQYPT